MLMAGAKQLVEEIEAYARDYPEQADFAQALRQMVERIRSEFEGSARETLLEDARSILKQQRNIHESSIRTLVALEKLKKSQQQLLKSLLRAATARPPGATLH